MNRMSVTGWWFARVLALVSLFLLSSTATSARDPRDPKDPGSPWRAFPSAAQVPGATGFHTGQREYVLFAFSNWSAHVQPADRQTDLFVQPAIDSLSLHCGVAGSEGPVVWSGDLPVVRPEAVLAHISGSEIQPVDPSPVCDMTIRDMDSLQAAARKRLLYVEYTRDGILKRGQLFPQSTWIHKVEGFLSESNYSTSGSVTGLWFPDMDTVRWAAHYRHHFGLDMTLRCGPPAVAGEIVAYLDPPGGRGQLSSADITPVDALGACGMAVNNIASLFEALLRGNIYLAYSPRCDGQTSPCGYDVVTTRAQFPPYNSDDPFIRSWLTW